MKLAIVGATGLVGSTMLQLIEELQIPVDTLIPVASEKSVGTTITFKGEKIKVISVEDAIALKPAIALFSAGGSVSLSEAPKFAAIGCYVIDNSSAWRMDPTKKLIVPEVNGHVLEKTDYIIANPNCSTIQMVMALCPLHKAYTIQRVVVSTYQSVTGTGQKAVAELMDERAGGKGFGVYPYPIDLNLIPQIDVFLDNGYTKEEMKMILETNKIMGDDRIQVTATAVRVPVMGGHSESVNIQFKNDFNLDAVRDLLTAFPGVVVQDNPAEKIYPMPLDAAGKNEVFVGRIRRDFSAPNTLNCWIVSDNLRKGAATNAVQIVQYLLRKNWLT